MTHHSYLWLFAFLGSVDGDSLRTAAWVSARSAGDEPAVRDCPRGRWTPGDGHPRSPILTVLSICYLGYGRAMTEDFDDDAAVSAAGLGVTVTACNLPVVALQ